MKKTINRPAIAFAVIVVLVFVIIVFESYVYLVQDLSLHDRIDDVFDEKIPDYVEELESTLETEPSDQLKYSQPTLNTQITLGIFGALNGTCFLRDGQKYTFNGPDTFTDLQNIIKSERWLSVSIDDGDDDDDDDDDHSKSDTLANLLDLSSSESVENSYVRFYSEISRNRYYSPKSNAVKDILYDLQTQPIYRIYEMDVGSQFKLQIFFDNEVVALFKPKRTSREEQAPPNQVPTAEYVRHTSEIAGFHLDGILEFYRASPTIGRNLNMIAEMMRVAEPKLQRTFFVSPKPDLNICFTGTCELYCDSYHPICGNKTTIEGSLSAYHPEIYGAERQIKSHPWIQANKQNEPTEWENNPNYCDDVKRRPGFENGHLLLELVDLSIFDFLTGNMNRHEYEQFKIFSNDTFVLHCDNGRAFGRAFYDELRILAPLLQCCHIRLSTLKTLLFLNNSEQPLSSRMRDSMEDDPIAPVLWELHLDALDRRLVIVLQAVRDCIDRNGAENVIKIANQNHST